MKLTTLSSLAVAAIAASQLGATDCGQITRDPGFDLWCGDQLCFWKTERGAATRVPTWIDGDDGVELDGDDVAISQMTAVTSDDTGGNGCVELDMTADIANDADVEVEMDLFGDGTVDYTQRVPTSDWEKQSVSVAWQGSFEGIRFRITKRGSGHAVVADMKAFVSNDCPPPIAVPARPDGARCAQPTDCTTGVCNGGVCSECASDADCGADVCGRVNEAGWLEDAHACVAPSSRKVGELCYTGAECASGLCDGELCQECLDATACQPGQACALAHGTEIGECAPGGYTRADGADCVQDIDCASARCVGTPQGYCTDQGVLLGLTPCYGDADCPLNADLSPVTCTFVAVAGGTCQ